ncbi:MAG: hypothetical protein E7373_02630 [Clostridiales bacterium]|nr:hypothetical protein [Clostridiales bacterium]
MSNKKYLSFICLSILCLSCFITGFLGLNVAKASKENVSFGDVVHTENFSSASWEADDIGDGFSFVSEKSNYESVVTSNETFSGSYSVIFKNGKIEGVDGTPMQMLVVLGAEAQTKIPFNNEVAYLNADPNTLYLAFNGTKLFLFDRESKYQEKEGGSGVMELGSPFWKHIYNFQTEKSLSFSKTSVKLVVKSGASADTLDIYISKSMDFSATADLSITLHKKGIADGYLQFSQAKSVHGGVTNSHTVSNIQANGKLLVESDFTVVGNENLVEFIGATKSVLYDNNTNAKIISKFKLGTIGLENGEEAFSLTFSGKRFAAETDDHKWGLVLGVDESGDLSTGTEIKFARNGVREADTPSGRCVHHCTKTPVALVPFTYTVKGFKGGRVEISYNDYKTCPTHTAVYNSVDFDGLVAFKIFNSSGLEGGYWEISNLTVDYVARVDRELELKLDNQKNNGLIVGDIVKLSTGVECEYEVVEGSEFATIDGDMLTALKVGEVKVKATLKGDDSVSAEFIVQIKEGENYNFEYKNGFDSAQDITTGGNACDFFVINGESGEIGINDVLHFKNTVGQNPVQVGLITPFTHDYKNDVVFDITFTVTVENSNQSVRNQKYTFGFGFGLDEIGANPLGEGASALLINVKKSEMYKDGEVVVPTYVTQNTDGAKTTYGKDSFGCYADPTCPLTVRLVAKSDGTLEYYRGIIYHRVGEKDVGTYLSDLFAVYSGFDFNGYVSMFTNVSKLDGYTVGGESKVDECDVKFDDLIVKGNFRIDDSVVPEVVDLGISKTIDLLHTELPIELDYYIYTVPNLDIFHGYKVEVVSGSASIDSQNRLVTTGAGVIKLKITSEIDASKFKEIELNIGELKIDAIEVDENLFKGLTNDSQAFYINAKLKGENTYITEYLTINYEVLEGEVSIIDGYLYINGAGRAKIRVYSHYLPSVEKVISFDVADNDLQYQNNGGGTLIVIIAIAVVVAVLAVVVSIVVVKKVKRGIK